jgi:hypothetical protein
LFLRKQWSNCVILLIVFQIAHPRGDTSRRAVWLGRHPAEKISVGPNGKLTQVGNLGLSVEAKAYLTVSCTATDAEMKVWLSDPTWLLNRARV